MARNSNKPRRNPGPVRVLWLVTPLPARGGTLTHLRTWFRTMDPDLVRPLLLYHSPEEDAGYTLELPVNLPRIRCASLNLQLRSLAHAVRDIRLHAEAWQADLIHTVFVGADLVGALAGWASGRPVVSSVEGDLLVPHMALWRRWTAAQAYRFLAPRIARIMAVSPATARQVRRLIGRDRPAIEVVYPGIPVPERLQPTVSPKAGAHLLAVGRLVPVKGFEHLVHAVGLCVHQVPGLHLTIVGDGPGRPALERTVAAHHLQSRVTLTGWVPPEQVAGWYRRADLVVISSVREGLPWVALEAMAHGVPVLATRVGGLPDLVIETAGRRTGFLVRPGDPWALAQAIERLLGRPRVAQDLQAVGRRARNRVASMFTAAREVEEILRIYREVLGEGRK